MCTNGVNITQLEQMIDQIDDQIALQYRWVHKIGHTSEDAGFSNTSAKLHEAQHLLGDVRSLLDEAMLRLESDAPKEIPDATVKLV